MRPSSSASRYGAADAQMRGDLRAAPSPAVRARRAGPRPPAPPRRARHRRQDAIMGRYFRQARLSILQHGGVGPELDVDRHVTSPKCESPASRSCVNRGPQKANCFRHESRIANVNVALRRRRCRYSGTPCSRAQTAIGSRRLAAAAVAAADRREHRAEGRQIERRQQPPSPAAARRRHRQRGDAEPGAASSPPAAVPPPRRRPTAAPRPPPARAASQPSSVSIAGDSTS